MNGQGRFSSRWWRSGDETIRILPKTTYCCKVLFVHVRKNLIHCRRSRCLHDRKTAAYNHQRLSPRLSQLKHPSLPNHLMTDTTEVDLETNYQDYLAWTYFGEHAFDRAEFERMEELLRGTTRFIDVGASQGVYTYHANRILENADIFAIEADPTRFSILKANVEKWSAGSSNTIHCINASASDEADRRSSPEITFYVTGTQISGGLFSVSERSDDYTPIRIPLLCVDDFFEPSSKTFVKIDVEGAELRVLQGAIRQIEAGNTRFLTEISWWGDRDRGTSALDVIRFCLRSGLRTDRRLRSDYLLSPEPDSSARLWSVMRCLPPLLFRVTYDTIVPLRLRAWRERRENRRRLSRYTGS